MKKVFNFGILLVAFLAIISYQSKATEYPHEEGKVKITIPDTWKVEINEETLTASTQDGTISLVFSIIEANTLDAALDEVDKQMATEFQEVKIGEPEEIEINGMSAVSYDGSATTDGTTIYIGGSLIMTPSNKVLFIFAAAAPDAMEKYEKDIEAIANSIKPL